MINKLITLVAIVMLTSSCDWCKVVPPYWQVNSFEVIHVDLDRHAYLPAAVYGDTCTLDVTYEIEGVENRVSSLPIIGTNSYALFGDCEPFGYEGLSDSLIDLVIYSTDQFNGIQAGDSIQNASSEYWNKGVYIKHFNEYWPFQRSRYLRIHLVGEDGLLTNQKFTVSLYFKSGKVISQSTPEFVWDRR